MFCIIRIILLLALALTVTPVQSQAQQSAADTVVARALASLRGGSGLATRMLRQQDGPWPRAVLDALADSLEAIARGELEGPADLAVNALGTGGWGPGVRYPEVFERLKRIYDQVPDTPIRAVVLNEMARLPNRGPVLAYLEEAATRQGTMVEGNAAMEAVNVLWLEMGPEGHAILRRLHREGGVSEQYAVYQLEFIAKKEGWQ